MNKCYARGRKSLVCQIEFEDPRAILAHFYGHHLHLALHDKLNEVKKCKDVLNNMSEVSNLLNIHRKEVLISKI